MLFICCELPKVFVHTGSVFGITFLLLSSYLIWQNGYISWFSHMFHLLFDPSGRAYITAKIPCLMEKLQINQLFQFYIILYCHYGVWWWHKFTLMIQIFTLTTDLQIVLLHKTFSLRNLLLSVVIRVVSL